MGRPIRDAINYLIDNFGMSLSEAKKIALTYALPWQQDELGFFLDSDVLDTQGRVWGETVMEKLRKRGIS